MRRTIVGVMGGCDGDSRTLRHAYELGRLIAARGWVLLNGGRPAGVMDASARGAHDAGGLSIGVLFEADREAASEHLDLVLPTGMGSARNSINVLASDVVVACRGRGGTLSEVALALRFGRPVVLLDFDPGEPFLAACGDGPWRRVATPADAVAAVADFLAARGGA